MEAGFFRPLLLAAAVLAVPAFYLAWRKTEKFGKLVALSRALIVLVIVAAAAQPYVETSKSFLEQPEVVVLDDRSTSTEIIQKPKLEFEDIRKRDRVIASGNSSRLRNGILRNLEEDTSYLAVSDFQATGESLAGLAEEFNTRNATLNALKPEADYDASVAIEGPETTVPGAENTYTVEVHTTGEVPTPEASLDGQPVTLSRIGNTTWELKRTFDSRGSHAFNVSIRNGGVNEVNDRYYKAIEVVEKPDVLIVGEQGALGERISEFYDVTYDRSVPEDLSPYYTVIATEDVQDQSLVPYVTEGNGLVYTADPTEDSLSVLPVRKDEQEAQTKSTNTIIAIDNSRALGRTEEQNRRLIQKVSGAVIDGLQTNNKVGIVYYNGTPQEGEAGIVREPQSLAQNRQSLKEGVAGLEPGGVAHHESGLEAASSLTGEQGNIILITNGALQGAVKGGDFTDTYGYDVQQDSFAQAESLDARLLLVGVNPPPSSRYNPQGEEFLQELADRSGGQYYPVEEILDGGSTVTLVGGGGQSSSSPVQVVDRSHFITRGLDLTSVVSETDPVESKRGSNELVRVANGGLHLTTWRYGVGRVAAYTADSPQLESTLRSDPRLVLRSVAWSVGDPKRKQERWIRAENSRQPESVELTANYDPGGFNKESQDTYSREFNPDSLGFHNYSGKLVSYNYPEEYQKVGYSEEMEDLVASTGGKVYTPGEKDNIASDVKSFSREEAVKKTSLSPFLLAAALLIFLAEVGTRKVKGKK